MPVQDVRLVDVHVRRSQRDQHAGAAARAVARARAAPRENARASCCSSCARLRRRASRRCDFTAPRSSSSRCVIDIGHVVATMRGEHPRHRRARGAREPSAGNARDCAHRGRWRLRRAAAASAGWRARARSAPGAARRTTSVRKRRSRERCDVEPRNSAATRASSAGVSARIGMSVRCTPGADDFARAEIPLVVFVAILPLGADVRDFLADARGRVEGFAAQAIATQLAIGGLRPHGARDELEQLRLAGAVAADQQPALPGLDAPRNVAQHRRDRRDRDRCGGA